MSSCTSFCKSILRSLGTDPIFLRREPTPFDRKHRVDCRRDADWRDVDRRDGHCPARDTRREEDGADREERCRVGDLPSHDGLRTLRKRRKALHAGADRLHGGDKRIESDRKARRSYNARRNVLVCAEIPAADQRGRERKRNNTQEKPRGDGIMSVLSRLKAM